LLVLTLLAGLILAGCGGKGPAPEAGEQAAAQAQDPPICLYLFWSRDPGMISQLQQRLEKGEMFPLAAKAVSDQGLQGASRLNATCMGPAELDPLLLEQARELEVGEVGPPFPYAGGEALVMRTTDRYWVRGRELSQRGEHAAAAASFRRHLELNPDAAAVWQALADSLAAQGQDQPALEALDQALAITPRSPSLLNDRAALLMRLGRGGEAVADYRRALELAPGNPLLMHNLAWALLKQETDLDLALSLAEQAVKQDPSNPRFWDTLGQVQKARGDFGDAVVSLHRALFLGARQKGTRQDLTSALLELPPEVVARLRGKRSSLPPLPKRPEPAIQPKVLLAPLGPLDAPAPRDGQPGAPEYLSRWGAPPLPGAAPAQAEPKPLAAAPPEEAAPPQPPPQQEQTARQEASAPAPAPPPEQPPAQDQAAAPLPEQAGPASPPQEEAAPPAEPADQAQPAGQPAPPEAAPQGEAPPEAAAAEQPAPAGEVPPPLANEAQFQDLLAPVEPEVLMVELEELAAAPQPADGEEDPPEEPARAEAPARPGSQAGSAPAGPAIIATVRRPLPAAKAKPAPAASRALEKLPAPPPRIPGYYILVGSFRYAELAAKEMRRWRRRKLAVWMEWKRVQGRGAWVRVMLGPYQKRAAALAAARKFQRRKLIRGFRVLPKFD
jgi:Flp pilus assembly protein TadD